MGTATALVPTTVLRIQKGAMMRSLHQPALADRFIAHMLVLNIRVEDDLVDQLFNSTEKRLARTLQVRRHSDGGRRTLERRPARLSRLHSAAPGRASLVG